ncbi:MAG TPA: hypothetical protein VNQ74_01655 [Burkholderiaceae bacterium]|nr:hypothetical protein [Burkholderiaceae bacterium]
MRRHRAANAYSLLEVVMASAICATALVPALAFMRDGMTLATTIDTKHMLLTYAVSKMEEQLAVVGATWAEGTIAGDFAVDGHPNIRFAAVTSDAPVSGGIDGRLMNLVVTTYSDDNANDVMDAAEARITVTTKISKLMSYENKASG